MTREVDESALLDRFSNKYKLIKSDLLKRIELSSCGCDYGSTSFTTLEQVKKLGSMLALGADKHLLEVGAGAGWPGLYLAKESGCAVTLTDLPIEGLRVAQQRAVLDELSNECSMVVASGSILPFGTGLFDAISHADVLCCLIEKLEVLQSCRSVVKPDGKMVFTVISIAPGLSETDYLKAVECGPSFIAAESSYPDLLAETDWELIGQIDLSNEFHETLKVMLNNELHYASDLEEMLGKKETMRRLSRTEESIYGLENSLIRRELFEAVPAKYTKPHRH